jgi:DNA transposition AAA+ family ATPase
MTQEVLETGIETKANNNAQFSAPFPAADVVKTALTENQQAAPGQVNDVIWLLNHARDRKLRSYSELGELIGYDTSVISKVFRGIYGAGLGAFCEKIRVYRALYLQRQDLGEEIFVEGLSIVRDVKNLCELTRISQTMSMIWGPNQSGKSKALKRYAKGDHGRTIYLRMPTGGSAQMMLQELAKACGISDRSNYAQLRDRIMKYLDASTLLIVDEVHQAMIGRTMKTTTIELIREIHDETGCGVVLCGTDVLPDMMQDPRFSKLLGQTDNRGVLKRKVPAAPTKRDVRLLCEAYGLTNPDGDAAEIVSAIAKKNGIGKLTKYFLMSRRLASKSNEPLGWKHFLATHATLTAWAEGKRSAAEENEE